MAVIETVVNADFYASELGRLGAVSRWLLFPGRVEASSREVVLLEGGVEDGVCESEVVGGGFVVQKMFDVMVTRVTHFAVPGGVEQNVVTYMFPSELAFFRNVAALLESKFDGLGFTEGSVDCGIALTSMIKPTWGGPRNGRIGAETQETLECKKGQDKVDGLKHQSE